MPLHILQLGPYPPPEGGISRNIIAIRDELRAGSHRCTIVATSQSTRLSDEPDVYHPRSPLALIALLRKLEYDVLHLHVGGNLTKRVLALAFACSAAAPNRCVLTVHSGGFAADDETKGKRSRSRWLTSKVFRRFTRLIAINYRMADLFRRYGVADERIVVIPPYSLQTPDESVEVPAELRAFYDKHSPVLLAVGGLEKDYQPLFLVEAMKGILTELPNAGLMIAGGGSMHAETEAAVVESGYSSAICLAGDVEHAVALHLIKDADVVLRTTLFDGDAISVREALFLGTPVVATDNGSRPEGVLKIESGDRDALVSAIKQALDDGTPTVSQQSPDNKNIGEVVKLYVELAGD